MKHERWTEEGPFYRDPNPERRILRKPRSLEFEKIPVERLTTRRRKLPARLVIHLPSERGNPAETPHLDQLKKDTDPEHDSILQIFIARGGPQSIVKRVVEKLGHKLTTASFEKNSIDPEAMGLGVGIAFERLAYLWLNNQIKDKNKNDKFVDPGSASRVFESLRLFNYHIDFTPDGLLFSNFNSSPILSALLEYKMSLLHNDELKNQLQRMKSFIDTFAGQTLHLRTKLDLYSSKRITTIKIAHRPNIILVIPNNHAGDIENIPHNSSVTVLTTPFPSDFVRQVTEASLRDFGKLPISSAQK